MFARHTSSARKFARDVRFARRISRGFRGIADLETRLEPRSLMACFQRSYIANPRVYSGLTTLGLFNDDARLPVCCVLMVHGEFFPKRWFLALFSSFILHSCFSFFFIFSFTRCLVFLYFNFPFASPAESPFFKYSNILTLIVPNNDTSSIH